MADGPQHPTWPHASHPKTSPLQTHPLLQNRLTQSGKPKRDGAPPPTQPCTSLQRHWIWDGEHGTQGFKTWDIVEMIVFLPNASGVRH